MVVDRENNRVRPGSLRGVPSRMPRQSAPTRLGRPMGVASKYLILLKKTLLSRKTESSDGLPKLTFLRHKGPPSLSFGRWRVFRHLRVFSDQNRGFFSRIECLDPTPSTPARRERFEVGMCRRAANDAPRKLSPCRCSDAVFPWIDRFIFRQ
jgi:hypothetical protein